MRRILAAVLLAGFAVRAADWPRFRGPNGSGVSDARDLPAEIGPEKNLAWRVKTPAGASSPVVAGGRLYVTAHEGDERVVLCLDARTGEQLWRRAVKRERAEPFNPTHGPATPTPVTDGSNVYVFFPEVGLLAYDAAGKEKWRTPLGPFRSVQGVATSPVLAAGNVVLLMDQTAESWVAAFDAATGKQKWKTGRVSGFLGGYSTPIVWEPEGGPAQVIASGALQVTGYQADTGEALWWITGLTNGPAAAPVLAGGRLYVSDLPGEASPPFSSMLALDKNKDGKIALDELGDPVMVRLFESIDREFGNKDAVVEDSEWSKSFGSFAGRGGLAAVRLGGRGDLTSRVEWRNTKGIAYVPSPLVYDGLVYNLRDGGVVTAVEAASGAEIKQARLPEALGSYYASPVAADGKVYFLSEAGKVTVVKAGRDLETLGSADLGAKCYATPAIADGRIYVRTADSVWCFARAATPPRSPKSSQSPKRPGA